MIIKDFSKTKMQRKFIFFKFQVDFGKFIIWELIVKNTISNIVLEIYNK